MMINKSQNIACGGWGIAFIAFSMPLLVASLAMAQDKQPASASEPQIAASPQLNLISNGAFAQWENDTPNKWEVGIGATDGAEKPESTIAKSSDGGIQLTGDDSTMAWKFVSQVVDAKPNDAIRFSFQAKSNGLKRQGNQKDNCFVGFVPTDTKGQRLTPLFLNIDARDFKSFDHFFNCPADMAQAEVWIFLSKTGTLNVKDLKIEKQLPENSFDMLVADMERHYSFFELKKIDWTTLTEKYRQRATEAESPTEFANVVTEMLGELKDIHVWVKHKKLKTDTFTSKVESNNDFNVVAAKVKNSGRFLGLGIVGDTDDNIAYVNLRSLTLPNPILIRHPILPDNILSRKSVDEILEKIVDRFEAPGMIIDLRRTGGGSEDIAKEIAGLFVEEPTLYAKSCFRNGDKPSDFGKPFERVLSPTQQNSYQGPVVCMIGPGTVSSAEALALMLKASPNCTLIGQPTRGASGNPRPVLLPNGVEVWYSRWKSLLLDETCVEGVGIQPDLVVEHKKGSDPTFEKAIEILKAKTKK